MRLIATRLTLACCLTLPLSAARAETPEAIAAPGQTLVVTVHAEGAQVYECKADTSGKLAWQFREPVATLIFDGKTVGRHYAGPSWELMDGSAVVGKVWAVVWPVDRFHVLETPSTYGNPALQVSGEVR